MTLGRLFRALTIVLAAAALAAAGAFYWSQNATPRYRAIARLLISPSAEASDFREALSALDALSRTQVSATYVEVLNSMRIAEMARVFLGLDSSGPDSPYEVRAVAIPESAVIEVISEGPSALMAADLANAHADAGSRYLDPVYTTYDLVLLDPAVPPTEPFAPNPPRDMALAGAVAAAFTTAMLVGLAALEEQRLARAPHRRMSASSDTRPPLRGGGARLAARR